jgi:hypothetical protein
MKKARKLSLGKWKVFLFADDKVIQAGDIITWHTKKSFG